MSEFRATHLREPMKKWMSEPTLLGDYGEEWINEWDNKEENGVSFTQEVAQPRLDNVTKQRVQLRPKRRPPSRGFVKSMANLDFDISFPEEIKEEEEEEEDTAEDSSTENDAIKTSTKPKVAPKPSDQNGAWKLPIINSNVLLKKTSSSNSKINDSVQEKDIAMKIHSDPEDPVTTPEPPPVPQRGKPRKRSKRFKFHLRVPLKFRGTKENGKKHEGIDKDTKSNLADSHCMSVDSGKLPLGEEAPKVGWGYRRRRKSEGERKRLSWLMQLFHMKNATPEGGDNVTKTSAVVPLPSNGNHGNTNGSEASGVEKDKTQTNGHVLVVQTESKSTNTDASNHEDENPESVSDLKKKFERISAAF